MDRNRKENVDVNSRPRGPMVPQKENPVDKNLHVRKMTPSDIKGATEKNKTLEAEAPQINEEQAP